MRIEYLYRYPVKGLTAEALEPASIAAPGMAKAMIPNRIAKSPRNATAHQLSASTAFLDVTRSRFAFSNRAMMHLAG
jgi:uncharacterized protein YcbX